MQRQRAIDLHLPFQLDINFDQTETIAEYRIVGIEISANCTYNSNLIQYVKLLYALNSISLYRKLRKQTIILILNYHRKNYFNIFTVTKKRVISLNYQK